MTTKTAKEYLEEARRKTVGKPTAYTDSEGNTIPMNGTVYSKVGAHKGTKGKVTGTSVMGNDVVVYYKDEEGETYFSKAENLVYVKE